MSLIVRIDVDRPYGRAPFLRHVLSRFSSDVWLPRMPRFGYLEELKIILGVLNKHHAPAHVFFRQCTLPSREVRHLLKAGAHEIGLHLEDSRSYDTFRAEKNALEDNIGQKITSFSKHGSGGGKFGRRHHPPYEPEKYLDWAERSGMKVFLGNLEDPTLPAEHARNLVFYPSAFWLEPPWRDTHKYTIDWLLQKAASLDIILLIHPENILASRELTTQFEKLVSTLHSRLLP